MLSKKTVTIIHLVLAAALLWCAKCCKKDMTAEGSKHKNCWYVTVLAGALLAVWHGRCLYKQMNDKKSSEE